MRRIGIVGERRRAHDAAFRGHVVTKRMVAGTPVQELVSRDAIYTNEIYRWLHLESLQAGAALGQAIIRPHVEGRADSEF